MHLKYYTADAICQAMGLPGFVEESWTQRDAPTLRLLLKPSLHPELCLTLFREKESTRLSVVSLSESFWTQVAAEVKRKRTIAQDAGGHLHEVKAPVPDLAAAHAEARRAEEEARRRAEEEGRRRLESEEGRWTTLTEEERAARVLALMMSAIPAVTKARRAEEEARRKAEELARRRAEERARRKAEELARLRFESGDVRWIEEEAHEVATGPKDAQRLLPSEREEVLLPSSAFDEIAKLFSEACAAFDLARWTFLDGMGSESCLVSRAGVHRFDARVSGLAMVAYVGKVIALAWSSCRRPRIRNALAEAAGYVDRNTDDTLKEVGQQCSAARKRSRRIEAKTLRKLKAKALRELKHLRTRRS